VAQHKGVLWSIPVERLFLFRRLQATEFIPFISSHSKILQFLLGGTLLFSEDVL
jgi:hypothetical protein